MNPQKRYANEITIDELPKEPYQNITPTFSPGVIEGGIDGIIPSPGRGFLGFHGFTQVAHDLPAEDRLLEGQDTQPSSIVQYLNYAKLFGQIVAHELDINNIITVDQNNVDLLFEIDTYQIQAELAKLLYDNEHHADIDNDRRTNIISNSLARIISEMDTIPAVRITLKLYDNIMATSEFSLETPIQSNTNTPISLTGQGLQNFTLQNLSLINTTGNTIDIPQAFLVNITSDLIRENNHNVITSSNMFDNIWRHYLSFFVE